MGPRHFALTTKAAVLAASLVMLAFFALALPSDASATYENGGYLIVSPLGGSPRWVNSSTRFHDGCDPYTSSYADATAFDTSSCHAAANGQWSMDLSAVHDDYVYIDVNPGGIDGLGVGGQYRVVAGDTFSWGGTNGGYQIFGVHTWNPNTASWENYGWVIVGHVNRFIYTVGQVVIAATYSRGTAIVAQVAPEGYWPEHLHLEVSNNNGAGYYSRSLDWDGPSNANDLLPPGPECSRTISSNDPTCNAKVTSSDVVGYVGGMHSSYAELDNWYYWDF